MPAVNYLLQVFIIWGAFWVVADASAAYDVKIIDEGINQHLPTRDLRHYPSDLARFACPEDYSPCICEAYGTVESFGLVVNCYNITVEEIQDVFSRTTTLYLDEVYLQLAMPISGAIHLPANLLQDKRVMDIYVSCPSKANSKLVLTLDPATFESSRLTTRLFYVNGCDLASQTDMQFFNGFSLLSTLYMVLMDNVECLSTLPTATLPQLQILSIQSCSGLQNVAFPDLTTTSLVSLHLTGNYLGDAAVNDILISVSHSLSATSLDTLLVNYNALTAVPSIAAFPKLMHFNIGGNAIRFISQSSLVFNAPVRYLDLRDNGIEAIEAGAFVGDFTSAIFNLDYNQLTQFREDVFLPVLQQMAGTSGRIGVTANPFECGCALAWLIRDNPALIQNVVGGVCDGFFKFEYINPESFANCTY